MATLDDVADYIITLVRSGGSGLSHLKLQKLAYYCQAWHLAFYGRPLFEGKFQAWVHGPVSRELFDRFRNTKGLYSEIHYDDRRPASGAASLTVADVAHISSVVEAYGRLSGAQLEDLSHRELPWIEARAGVPSTARSENVLSEQTMATYYRSRS